MCKRLVPEALWERIAPLLLSERPKPEGGRPRMPDHAVLTGIIFALKTGIGWQDLSKRLGNDVLTAAA